MRVNTSDTHNSDIQIDSELTANCPLFSHVGKQELIV